MPAFARPRLLRHAAVVVAAALALAGCREGPREHRRTPAEVRAEVARLMPANVRDRSGWAADIQAAFAALKIEPNTGNICSVLAVTEQESTFSADPAVPGLGRIALEEIDRRMQEMHIPPLLARTALRIDSPDGRTWEQRIAAATTERELSDVYEAMIARVPLGGGRLLEGANPVRTGGPMQVSVTFAQALAKSKDYPYPVEGSIRREVFTRRGGMYFGIAHLLGYRASYRQPVYRFADFNAGWYASRNAAFQNAVSIASGIPLQEDGDLVREGDEASLTESAVRTLSQELGMDEGAIRGALRKSRTYEFEQTALYRDVFELAERSAGHALPRARVPEIRLSSPKIHRKLTTAWFADRVNTRYRRCMARAKG